MNNVPLCPVERAAYHEAGHLVMARELGLRIDAVRMPLPLELNHASRFASLGEMFALVGGDDRLKRLAVRKYLRFLLAGPAAVLLRLEAHHDLDETSPHRARFRCNWLKRTLSRNDADLDTAYALLLAWGRACPEKDLGDEFQRQWTLALAAYQYPTLWRRVRRVALRLIERHPQEGLAHEA